uniref:BTB domain-containing protein n=1 Tax=Anopheles epiroticus TaxID=199890 RepID=A0A182PEW5_9DIPT
MGDINIEEIEDTALLAVHMASLCMNEDKADVTLIVENERIPAHRLILSARSEYFQALLYGGLEETKQDEVTIKVPLQPFKILLRYMYSGSLSLKDMKDEDILDTLGLAIQYGFISVEKAIVKYLSLKLTVSNVCAVIDAARLFDLADLVATGEKFADRHASDVLQDETFQNITFESLDHLLDRDSFDAPEIEIFHAVRKWCEAKPEDAEQRKKIYDKVRFPLLSHSELDTIVRPTGVLDADRLLDIVMEKEKSYGLYIRGTVPGQNVVKENIKWVLLYDDLILCAYITMEKAHIVNCVQVTYKMNFSSLVDYYLDVSDDEKCWERVGEFHHMEESEVVYFRTRPVRYIRISTGYNDEEIESVKAMLFVKDVISDCVDVE